MSRSSVRRRRYPPVAVSRRCTPSSTLLILIAGVLVVSAAQAESLQDYWDANKAPEGDYEFAVHLDSLAVYTGGLYINSGINCRFKRAYITIRVVVQRRPFQVAPKSFNQIQFRTVLGQPNHKCMVLVLR